MSVLVLKETNRLGPRVSSEVESLSEITDVEVLYWNRDSEPKRDGDSEYYVNVPAPSGSLRLLMFLPLVYLKLLLKSQERDPDIIHCTHLLLLPLSLVLKYASGRKIVYDAHERHAITMSYYFTPLDEPARRVFEWVENRMVERTDYVLTVDSPNGMLVKRYRQLLAEVHVLNNFPNPTNNVREVGNETERPTLAYVGNITRDKGSLKMIECLRLVRKDFPEARLVLIGEFDDSKIEVDQLIEEYDLGEHVKHIEWVPYDEMMRHLRRADIGLAIHQPVRRFKHVSKGTGRKFLTYMDAELPIVGPEFWEVGAIVREANCGILVDTTDPGEIAAAVRELLNDPERASRLGQNGRQGIVNEYNWENEEVKQMHAYQHLLS